MKDTMASAVKISSAGSTNPNGSIFQVLFQNIIPLLQQRAFFADTV